MWLTLCRLTRGLTVGVTSRQLESLRRRDLWEPGDPAPLWDAVLWRDEDRGGGTGDEATGGSVVLLSAEHCSLALLLLVLPPSSLVGGWTTAAMLSPL